MSGRTGSAKGFWDARWGYLMPDALRALETSST